MKANSIVFNYTLFNATDGKQIETSYGKGTVPLDLSSTRLMKGQGKGLTRQLVGSRLLVAAPPADAYGAEGNTQAGVGPTDTIVFLIDVISAITPLSSAAGVAVPPKAGLPTAIVDGTKAAIITVPKTAPPTKLVVQPLITGSGQVVTSGQTIKVNYTGLLWKDGKKFDASSDHGSPMDMAPRAPRRSRPRTPWCSSSTSLPDRETRVATRLHLRRKASLRI